MDLRQYPIFFCVMMLMYLLSAFHVNLCLCLIPIALVMPLLLSSAIVFRLGRMSLFLNFPCPCGYVTYYLIFSNVLKLGTHQWSISFITI
jgi:hypothetical protein